MSEMKAFEELIATATRRPFRLSGDAGHPANIRITSTQRRHVAKVYAESTERDVVCEANARLLTLAANNVGRLVSALIRMTDLYGDTRVSGTSPETDAARQLLREIEEQAK